MKRLGAFFYWVVGEGGFGRTVYSVLAIVFLIGTVAEVAANGFSTLVWVEGFLTVAMVSCALGAD